MLSEHGPSLAVRVETPLYNPHRADRIGVLRLRFARTADEPPLRMTYKEDSRWPKIIHHEAREIWLLPNL